jgi:hypothetical protein
MPSPPHYIVSLQWVGAGYGKVLIPNPDYKGIVHTESASLKLTPRLRHHPHPKIHRPTEMMEFFDEEEEEELCNELGVSLK